MTSAFRISIGAIVVVVVVFIVEARVGSGATRPCRVDTDVGRGRNRHLQVRCDQDVVEVSISPIAAIVHGRPQVGDAIHVRVRDHGRGTWDKPAARHPFTAILAVLAAMTLVKLWWRRTTG